MNISAESPRDLKLWQVGMPIVVLLLLIVYSLILRPRFFGVEPFPLEIVFVISAAFTIIEMRLLGFRWEAVQKTIVSRLGRAMPAFFILFTIGVIISSWIVCGTIPMLVYYGIKIIHPHVFYLLAFLVPILFSTLTGTSFGSIGTVGVVLIGIATALEANLGITAGAIIGGAFFGDKLSPLSDTTNLAAMTVEVPLYSHIRSMLYTTIPSAALAAAVYAAAGILYPPEGSGRAVSESLELLSSLEGVFHFNVFLLIPPFIVLAGSVWKKPVLPVMAISILFACLLAVIFQDFAINDIVVSLVSGFNLEMAGHLGHIPPLAAGLLNRGGLYELVDVVVLSFVVFIYIGSIDHLGSMPVIIEKVMGRKGKREGTVITSLFATLLTTAVTLNQYATIFLVGDAFRNRYDREGIPRRVLSRSLEDYGTMTSSLIPWHTATIFAVSVLGIPFSDYWSWQLMSLFNLVIAPLLAITGIGCNYGRVVRERRFEDSEKI